MVWGSYNKVIKELDKEHIENLYPPAVNEITSFFEDLVEHQIKEAREDKSFNMVLNVKPGHGKTTALMLFLAKILAQEETNKDKSFGNFSCLIVVPEVSQMEYIESFLKQFSKDANSVRYVNAENLEEIRHEISRTRFLIATHARLKNEAINKMEGLGINKDLFEWLGKERIIFIDERPRFDYGATFTLEDNLDWVTECFEILGANKIELSPQEKVIIRSMISIAIAKELLKSSNEKNEKDKPIQTSALKDSVTGQKELDNFFKKIENNLHLFRSNESFYHYRWFKSLYEGKAQGYIDSGFTKNGYNDFSKIICAKRINYQSFNKSIIILDGSAHLTDLAYKDYEIERPKSYTKYENVFIHHRVINTSAYKRRQSSKSAQNLIKNDLNKIEEHLKLAPVLLFSKQDELEFLSQEEYLARHSQNMFDNHRPLHLLNTSGKNELESKTSIYLTNLPIRAAVYYKTLAISYYPDKKLNLSNDNNLKKGTSQWFADNDVEEVYKQEIFSELFQIIHRTMLRNINRDMTIPINIFIATNIESIVDEFGDELGIKVKKNEVEKNERISENLHRFGPEFIEKLEKYKRKGGSFPTTIGRVWPKSKGNNPFRNLINNHWNNKKSKKDFEEYFQEHNYVIYVEKNGWKYINLFEDK